MTVTTPHALVHSENSAVLAINGGDDGVILLRFKGWDESDLGYPRRQWEFRIYDSDHKEVGSDDDLRTTEYADAEAAMSALLSFLGACAEARDESSENWTLFTPGVRDWAKIYSDELAMIQMEMEDANTGG